MLYSPTELVDPKDSSALSKGSRKKRPVFRWRNNSREWWMEKVDGLEKTSESGRESEHSDRSRTPSPAKSDKSEREIEDEKESFKSDRFAVQMPCTRPDMPSAGSPRSRKAATLQMAEGPPLAVSLSLSLKPEQQVAYEYYHAKAHNGEGVQVPHPRSLSAGPKLLFHNTDLDTCVLKERYPAWPHACGSLNDSSKEVKRKPVPGSIDGSLRRARERVRAASAAVTSASTFSADTTSGAETPKTPPPRLRSFASQQQGRAAASCEDTTPAIEHPSSMSGKRSLRLKRPPLLRHRQPAKSASEIVGACGDNREIIVEPLFGPEEKAQSNVVWLTGSRIQWAQVKPLFVMAVKAALLVYVAIGTWYVLDATRSVVLFIMWPIQMLWGGGGGGKRT